MVSLSCCPADSPAPAEPAAGRRVPSLGQLQGLAPIRVPRGALSNRPGSPGGSFSFGNRPEDEVRWGGVCRVGCNIYSKLSEGNNSLLVGSSLAPVCSRMMSKWHLFAMACHTVSLHVN
jgi:hypothetical protein